MGGSREFGWDIGGREQRPRRETVTNLFVLRANVMHVAHQLRQRHGYRVNIEGTQFSREKLGK